jgi:RNA polymerase sigma-70 factor (sigma-E family)
MKAVRDEEFRLYVLTRRIEMVRTATLLTAGDQHLAEDLVQSTLTQLYLAWPAFQRAANPRAYARRALVNALVDEKRRPWRRREHSTPDLPEYPFATDSGSNTATDQLNRALGQLPPRMRAAIVLRYYQELSVAETADALGCTQGTVKSQTARALDRLRQVLDLSADEPGAAPPGPRTPSYSPATVPMTNL